jgi:hypothetical protein
MLPQRPLLSGGSRFDAYFLVKVEANITPTVPAPALNTKVAAKLT